MAGAAWSVHRQARLAFPRLVAFRRQPASLRAGYPEGEPCLRRLVSEAELTACVRSLDT